MSARADASPGQGADDTRRVPDAVRRIIVERLGVREAEVTWEARFVEDLGADSLATVELQLTFEQEFAIDIPDDVAERLVRVGDVVEYLRKREVLR